MLGASGEMVPGNPSRMFPTWANYNLPKSGTPDFGRPGMTAARRFRGAPERRARSALLPAIVAVVAVVLIAAAILCVDFRQAGAKVSRLLRARRLRANRAVGDRRSLGASRGVLDAGPILAAAQESQHAALDAQDVLGGEADMRLVGSSIHGIVDLAVPSVGLGGGHPEQDRHPERRPGAL